MKDELIFATALLALMFMVCMFSYIADKQKYEHQIEIEKVRCAK